jgi:hypothetical protein
MNGRSNDDSCTFGGALWLSTLLIAILSSLPTEISLPSLMFVCPLGDIVPILHTRNCRPHFSAKYRFRPSVKRTSITLHEHLDPLVERCPTNYNLPVVIGVRTLVMKLQYAHPHTPVPRHFLAPFPNYTHSDLPGIRHST